MAKLEKSGDGVFGGKMVEKKEYLKTILADTKKNRKSSQVLKTLKFERNWMLFFRYKTRRVA